MFGEPKDVDGECNTCLFIGDNYGDNSTTIRCQLAPNHEGLHQEQFEREGGMVTITWVTDERKKCDHGCGQWQHNHGREETCPKYADDHEFSDCAYCHPNKESAECAECGKTYYYEGGHKRHCPGQPFACTDCGENGHGVHVCPRSSDGSFDEFSEEPWRMLARIPQDSTGRPIGVGDRVSWRGQIYTIKAFGEAVGRHGTRAILFEEPLHHAEVPDEIAVDLVERSS